MLSSEGRVDCIAVKRLSVHWEAFVGRHCMPVVVRTSNTFVVSIYQNM